MQADALPCPPEEGDTIVVRFWGASKKGKVLEKDVDGVKGRYKVQYKSCTLDDFLIFPWKYAADSPKRTKLLKGGCPAFPPRSMTRVRTQPDFFTVQHALPPSKRQKRSERILMVEAFSDSDDDMGEIDASCAMMMLSTHSNGSSASTYSPASTHSPASTYSPASTGSGAFTGSPACTDSCASSTALSELHESGGGSGAGEKSVNLPNDQEKIELDALIRIRQTASAIRVAL